MMRITMNVNAVKYNQDLFLPENYQTLTGFERDEIMSGLVPCKEMTPDECRAMLDERLGETSLSELLLEMRRED